ncbi:MAG: serine protease [Acidimicrobiia bacterium]|nr:serine protease [Acidimicrobiia bacterium]
MRRGGEPDPTRRCRPSIVIGVALALVVTGCAGQARFEVDGGAAPTLRDVVAPSVVYVLTPDALGSGFLLDDGSIVTNAHVVDLYGVVSVVVPGEPVKADVAVTLVDRHADIAVLEPIATNAPGLTVATDSPADGEPVFVFGYPGSFEFEPEVSMQQTFVSRRRRSRIMDLVYFQLDDAIAGGTSGGPVVDRNGEVVGLVTFAVTEASFGMALSLAELAALPTENAEDPDDIFAAGDSGTSFGVEIEQDRQVAYLLEADQELEDEIDVEVRIEGAADALVEITTLGGFDPNPLPTDADFVDPPFLPEEPGPYVSDYAGNDGATAMATIRGPGRYLVTVRNEGETGLVALISSHDLVPFRDDEDSRSLAVNDITGGVIDHIGDTDEWALDLEAGSFVEIEVSGLLDTAATLRLGDSVITSNDDGGGGIFRLDPFLFAEIAESGTYTLEVGSFFEPGGYVVDVFVG